MNYNIKFITEGLEDCRAGLTVPRVRRVCGQLPDIDSNPSSESEGDVDIWEPPCTPPPEEEGFEVPAAEEEVDVVPPAEEEVVVEAPVEPVPAGGGVEDESESDSDIDLWGQPVIPRPEPSGESMDFSDDDHGGPKPQMGFWSEEDGFAPIEAGSGAPSSDDQFEEQGAEEQIPYFPSGEGLLFSEEEAIVEPEEEPEEEQDFGPPIPDYYPVDANSTDINYGPPPPAPEPFGEEEDFGPPIPDYVAADGNSTDINYGPPPSEPESYEPTPFEEEEDFGPPVPDYLAADGNSTDINYGPPPSEPESYAEEVAEEEADGPPRPDYIPDTGNATDTTYGPPPSEPSSEDFPDSDFITHLPPPKPKVVEPSSEYESEEDNDSPPAYTPVDVDDGNSPGNGTDFDWEHHWADDVEDEYDEDETSLANKLSQNKLLAVDNDDFDPLNELSLDDDDTVDGEVLLNEPEHKLKFPQMSLAQMDEDIIEELGPHHDHFHVHQNILTNQGVLAFMRTNKRSYRRQ